MHSDLDLWVLRSSVDEREARLRRAHLSVSWPHSERRSTRRWIGHQLIRVGERLASEPTLRPVRSP